MNLFFWKGIDGIVLKRFCFNDLILTYRRWRVFRPTRPTSARHWESSRGGFRTQNCPTTLPPPSRCSITRAKVIHPIAHHQSLIVQTLTKQEPTENERKNSIGFFSELLSYLYLVSYLSNRLLGAYFYPRCYSFFYIFHLFITDSIDIRVDLASNMNDAFICWGSCFILCWLLWLELIDYLILTLDWQKFHNYLSCDQQINSSDTLTMKLDEITWHLIWLILIILIFWF